MMVFYPPIIYSQLLSATIEFAVVRVGEYTQDCKNKCQIASPAEYANTDKSILSIHWQGSDPIHRILRIGRFTQRQAATLWLSLQTHYSTNSCHNIFFLSFSKLFIAYELR